MAVTGEVVRVVVDRVEPFVPALDNPSGCAKNSKPGPHVVVRVDPPVPGWLAEYWFNQNKGDKRVVGTVGYLTWVWTEKASGPEWSDTNPRADRFMWSDSDVVVHKD